MGRLCVGGLGRLNYTVTSALSSGIALMLPSSANLAGPGGATTALPGERLRFSWHPGREADSAQWVEVSFERMGRGSRVTLTHGGWETLGEIAPILRREYVPGWQQVFGELFGAYARRRH